VNCIQCGSAFVSLQQRGTKRQCCYNCTPSIFKRNEIKKCATCGEGFTALFDDQRTCSNKCRKPKQILPDRQCALCGKTFTPYLKKLRFCSPECSSTSNRRIQDRTCQHCSKSFRPKHGKYTTFCSRDCSFAFKAGHKKPRFCTVYFPICSHCGGIFTARKYTDRFCSAECRPKPIYIPKPIRTIACVSCGCAMKTLPGRGSTRLYCDPCAEIAKRDTRNAAKRLRKARRKDAFVERVIRQRIYERDRWKCGICKRKVDPSLEVPHPLSKTIDHIIPLSKGGTHEPRNVQLAHFICNSKRSNKGGVQLRLM
jgi:hypothetical protein